MTVGIFIFWTVLRCWLVWCHYVPPENIINGYKGGNEESSSEEDDCGYGGMPGMGMFGMGMPGLSCPAMPWNPLSNPLLGNMMGRPNLFPGRPGFGDGMAGWPPYPGLMNRPQLGINSPMGSPLPFGFPSQSGSGYNQLPYHRPKRQYVPNYISGNPFSRFSLATVVIPMYANLGSSTLPGANGVGQSVSMNDFANLANSGLGSGTSQSLACQVGPTGVAPAYDPTHPCFDVVKRYNNGCGPGGCSTTTLSNVNSHLLSGVQHSTAPLISVSQNSSNLAELRCVCRKTGTKLSNCECRQAGNS